MNRAVLCISAALLASLIGAPSWAEPPIVKPNDFTSGTRAMASEVNENFDTVYDRVNNHESRIIQQLNMISGKQNAIAGTCPAGSSIRIINSNGTVVCETDDGGGGGGTGNITEVLTTAPLAGGAASGSVSLYLQSGGITAAHLGTNSVGASEIATGAVGSDEIATGAVGSDEIATDAVGSAEISSEAVGSDEIAPAAVGSAKIAAGAVGTAALADGAVTSVKTDSSSVQTRVVGTCGAGYSIRVINADGSVTCEQDDGGAGDITSVSTTSPLQGGAASGDVTLSIQAGGIDATHLGTESVGSDEIQANAVGASEIETGAVNASEIATDAVGTDEIATDSVTSDEIAVGAVGSSEILNGSVGAADVNTAQIQLRVTGGCPLGQSIRTINADGTVYCEIDDTGSGGGGTGDITSVLTTSPLSGGAASGDVTISITANGITAAQLATGSVATDEILDGTITSSDVLTSSVQVRVAGSCSPDSFIRVIRYDGTVVCETDTAAASTAGALGDITGVFTSAPLAGGAASGDVNLSIQANGITAGHLATNSVGSDEIQSGAVGSDEITSGAVGADEIASGAVGADEIASNAVGADEIASGAVGSSEIAAGSISAAHLTVDSVGSNEIMAAAVQSSEIASGAIITSKIANLAVNLAKIDTTQVQARVSGACGAGQYIRTVYANGTVQCGDDTVGTGDITAVLTAAPLSGGASSGSVSLSLLTNSITAAYLASNSVGSLQISSGAVGNSEIATGAVNLSKIDATQVQARVSATCPAGQSIRIIDNAGNVTCEVDDNSGGTITGVTAGSGLTGGGTTGIVSVAIGTGSVTATHLGTDSVAADEIAAGAVGTAEIADGAITNADISASAGISASKIEDAYLRNNGDSTTSGSYYFNNAGGVLIASYNGGATNSDYIAVQGTSVPNPGYGYGGYFYGGYRGVYGYTSNTYTGTKIGVQGASSNGGDNYGVWGQASGGTGDQVGVYGSGSNSTANYGYGIYGTSYGGSGGNGAYGVYGTASGYSPIGVYGTITSISSGGAFAIRGAINSSLGSFTAYGVHGQVTNTGYYSYGVIGEAYNNTSGGTYGVYGYAYNAVAGYSRYGVYAYAYGASGATGSTYGIYAYAGGYATNYAGYFSGNVYVSGTLTKGGGSFKIDHPLDPENKYLYHSFVESPDMKNIYDGVATLDNWGQAMVQLPDWFEALNKDFRYQLTPIGGGASNLHIAEEVANNRFLIAGGVPNQRVSWQVTGTRQDAWANANRIPVEQDKPESEVGTYLFPEGFGAPEEMSVDWSEKQDRAKHEKELKEERDKESRRPKNQPEENERVRNN